MSRFVDYILTGMELARMWGDKSARRGFEVAAFMHSGCIDAPDEIPAGGWRSYEYGPTENDHGIGPITYPREGI